MQQAPRCWGGRASFHHARLLTPLISLYYRYLVAIVGSPVAMSAAAPSSETQPTKFAVALFPGFQLLDVAGPLDVLNILAQTHPHSLYILSSSLEPVHAGQRSTFRETVVPTHTFDSAPEDIEVLLVPGGYGARDRASIQPLIDYATRVYPKLQYLLTVCTGSAIIGMGGLLDGKKATTNKASWDWVSCVKLHASRGQLQRQG